LSLHPELQKLIDTQEEKGGVKLDKLEQGTILKVQTQNSLYTIKKIGDGLYTVQGGRYFPAPLENWIAGSTWGGSALKVDYVGIDMHIEMGHPDPNGSVLVTSSIQSIKIIGPNQDWEYEITTE
jgi:hypothetical protein